MSNLAYLLFLEVMDIQNQHYLLTQVNGLSSATDIPLLEIAQVSVFILLLELVNEVVFLIDSQLSSHLPVSP